MKKQTFVGTKFFGECEDCEGTALQVQDEGVMKGMIRPCQSCGRDWKIFENQYGTDEDDGHPDVYIDTEKGILAKVEKGKDSIIIPGMGELEIKDHDPIAEKLNKT